MGIAVSSWFYEQLQLRTSQPRRVLTLCGSDYTDRVYKWPQVRRTAEVQSVKVDIQLANTDGGLNDYYAETYRIPGECKLQMGFTHPDSGDEMIDVFTGYIKKVSYTDKYCKVTLRDRLFDFSERVVGDGDAPVTFSHELVSDIAWTLCTCYGGLSAVQSGSNPDVDWDSFGEFAAVYSNDNVRCSAHYEGEKIAEALTRLAQYTDAAIWVEGDGRLHFRRYSEPSSLDFVVTRNDQVELTIDVDGVSMVNRQWVDWDYSVESDYWAATCFAVDTTSVNTFSLREDRVQDETIWFVNSDSALNMAQRRVGLLRYPPKRFSVDTGLIGRHRQIGETIRLVDSFYSISSESGWRFIEDTLDMDRGLSSYLLDEATVLNAFYVDFSDLDGNDSLL